MQDFHDHIKRKNLRSSSSIGDDVLGAADAAALAALANSKGSDA